MTLADDALDRLRDERDRVRALAQWAVEYGTGPAGWQTTPSVGVTVTELGSAVRCGRKRGFPDGECLAEWRLFYACAPDAEAQTYLRRLLTGRVPEVPRVEVEGWARLGVEGPLAYAAGLSHTEAYERQYAGTLDAEGLGTLAALRGWRFPPAR